MSKDKHRYGAASIPDPPKESRRRSAGSGDGGKIREIEEAIEEIKNSMIKSNRDNMDSMNNIDMDNLDVSFRRVLAAYKDGISEAKSSIDAWANETEASFASIAQWQKTVEEGTISSIASINQKADENSADISVLASWKTTADEDIESLTTSVALIKATADENEASITQIVSAVGANGSVTAASIVTAVNNSGSSVKINADKVEIDNLYTKKVLLNTNMGDYTMVTSRMYYNNAEVHVGVQDENGWAHFTYFHGHEFVFIPPGKWDEDDPYTYPGATLIIKNMNDQLKIYPESDRSELGTSEYPFGRLWANEVCFGSHGSLFITSRGRIRYYPDPDGDEYEELVFASEL